MSLGVRLSPQVAQWLAAQAEREQVKVSTMARRIIEHAASQDRQMRQEVAGDVED
jgi:hypothetical protein